MSPTVTRWLEQERRTERASAAVLSMLALGSGTVVFLVATVLVYIILHLVCGAFFHSAPLLGLAALGLTAGFFAHSMKGSQNRLELGLDPMGFWIFKDISSFGPRLILEGLRQVRRCGELGELNVAACARALAFLAGQNAAVNWEELIQHCPQLSAKRLREQLSLLHGVLFLGEDASRVILMEPFRLRLRAMLEQEQAGGKWQEPIRPRPEPAGSAVLVTEPEKLSPYELLGLTASASMIEIKTAYRKRVKECHPDLFAGMDEQAKALAERWTRALNAAYATLNPRHRGTRPSSTRH